MICEKYSSRACIILVLEKTKCLVRQIKTGMPRLAKTNHAELYPEILNSLNKNAANEMSEYLHDRIRKHATKQARRNPSVFPRSSANFLFCGLLSCPWRESTFKKVMLKGHCHAIWQLYKKPESVFASVEFLRPSLNVAFYMRRIKY